MEDSWTFGTNQSLDHAPCTVTARCEPPLVSGALRWRAPTACAIPETSNLEVILQYACCVFETREYTLVGACGREKRYKQDCVCLELEALRFVVVPTEMVGPLWTGGGTVCPRNVVGMCLTRSCRHYYKLYQWVTLARTDRFTAGLKLSAASDNTFDFVHGQLCP